MVGKRSFRPFKDPSSIDTDAARRKSLVVVASATKALQKVISSSKTIKSLLSSGSLTHSEVIHEGLPATPNRSPSHSKRDNAGQQSLIQQYSDAKLNIPLCRQTVPSKIESDYNAESSLELQRTESLKSTQRNSGSSQSASTHDSSRLENTNRDSTFHDDPIHIHGSQMVHRRDIGPMIELHKLVWRNDRLLRRLQRSQVPSAEVQIMMKMLGDRTRFPLDNVLVARTNKSRDLVDIVGWLSCSIIRFKNGSNQLTAESEIRAMSWNLATAVNLNTSHNAGSITCLSGDSDSLKDRNYLIEVFCTGSRRCLKQEFPDQDFIAITNLVVHPNYPFGRDVAKRLVLAACNQASILKMPLYVSSSSAHRTQLFKEECGFSELGEHVNLTFDPVYAVKYLVLRPTPQELDILHNGRESSRFEFGWKTTRGL